MQCPKMFHFLTDFLDARGITSFILKSRCFQQVFRLAAHSSLQQFAGQARNHSGNPLSRHKRFPNNTLRCHLSCIAKSLPVPPGVSRRQVKQKLPKPYPIIQMFTSQARPVGGLHPSFTFSARNIISLVYAPTLFGGLLADSMDTVRYEHAQV